MKIGFVGAGRAGTALGIYFYKQGLIISGYYSKDITDALKASKLTASRAYNNAQELLDESDIIMITTNDDQIEKSAEYLSDMEQIRVGHFFIHVSGALTSEVLISLSNKGCKVCSLHPLQAIASPTQGAEALKKTTFVAESFSKEAIDEARKLVNRLGNRFQVIEAENKAIYHAGACVLSNYMVSLADSAFSYFQAAGIEKEDILKITEPLIRSSLENIFLNGTEEALTGPIARGDLKTVEKHINEINKKIPKELELYICMAKKTIEIADRIREKGGQNKLEIGGIFDEREIYNS